MLHSSLVLLILCLATANDYNPLSQEFIDLVNLKAKTWKERQNFHPSMSIESVTGLMGALPEDPNDRPPEKLPTFRERKLEIPASFDAREKWPHCPSIGEIQDQGSCGSCWAVGATSTMSDRLCIHSNGTVNVRISATDMMSCCQTCGHGCRGGYTSAAWKHLHCVGVATGGDYASKQGCRPYEIPPCMHHVEGPRPTCLKELVPTPPCRNVCQAGYNVPYDADKYFTKDHYIIRNAEAIQREILVNGPVEAVFTTYEDFASYKSGVYIHVHGPRKGDHAVRLLGWGVENGTLYWLAANSWNNDWGDKGFFKILRGRNHCGIESCVTAGIPLLE